MANYSILIGYLELISILSIITIIILQIGCHLLKHFMLNTHQENVCKLNVSSEALNITGLDSGYSTVFPKAIQ